MSVQTFASEMFFGDEDIEQILSPLFQERSVVTEEFHMHHILQLKDSLNQEMSDMKRKYHETVLELQEVKQLLFIIAKTKEEHN